MTDKTVTNCVNRQIYLTLLSKFCRPVFFRRFSSAFVKIEEAQKRWKESQCYSKLNSKPEDEVHERIEQKVDVLASNVEKQCSFSVQDVVRTTRAEDKVEEAEIKRRSTSIIIHGLAEPQASSQIYANKRMRTPRRLSCTA